jgi:fucose permease
MRHDDGIALGLMLGQLADRLGRRPTSSRLTFRSRLFLLAAGTRSLFAVMLGVSGLAIGVFKTGALALIGDISTSTAQHTSIANTVEGFFGVAQSSVRRSSRACWLPACRGSGCTWWRARYV